jgi:hypothetical protein
MSLLFPAVTMNMLDDRALNDTVSGRENVTSIRTAAMVLLAVMGFLSVNQQAGAQDGPSAWPEWTCADYPGTVEEARAYYTEFGGPATLDPDGDGIACNEDTGPSAWPEWTCETFPDGWDAAIEYYNTHGGPATLDADGDGVPCNEATTNGPSAWPTTSCYTFPDGWNAAIDYYHQYGGPASLDADGDGIPCEPNGDDEMVECRDLGGPQHIAQDYYEANGMPENLDLDGDGLACMNTADGYWGDTPLRPASLPNEGEANAPEDTDAPGDDEIEFGETSDDGAAAGASSSDATAGPATTSPVSSGTVIKLPSTGTGSADSAPLPVDLLVCGALLAVIAAAVTLRGMRRTA